MHVDPRRVLHVVVALPCKHLREPGRVPEAREDLHPFLFRLFLEGDNIEVGVVVVRDGHVIHSRLDRAGRKLFLKHVKRAHVTEHHIIALHQRHHAVMVHGVAPHCAELRSHLRSDRLRLVGVQVGQHDLLHVSVIL